ncbi:hypothetical protein C923_00973 [Plasmodium falciparum UGT5.1]|uniref:Uncharacterized protein n=1 Tax=Plasmodium falciparum UGT5.1 TaxID=1237627 RepID=W7JTZ0_PLAFA|nr:hypothetical protein C923_00973 [Plasmodium falciparum UGT5.1]
MKDIIKTNEKPFYKRALLLLDIFDNIFIDKLSITCFIYIYIYI